MGVTIELDNVLAFLNDLIIIAVLKGKKSCCKNDQRSWNLIE